MLYNYLWISCIILFESERNIWLFKILCDFNIVQVYIMT